MWTVEMVRPVKFSPNMVFYASDCPGCHRGLPVSAQEINEAVFFTCPVCSHVIPHGKVELLDTKTLQEQHGWVADDDSGPALKTTVYSA
jgi:hypothetical protein